MITIPNLLTALNMASGTGALILVSKGKLGASCWLILVAALFDGLDGCVARWLNQESDFGRVFDSLADFVSFGVAPAVIFYLTFGHGSPFVSFLTLIAFILASAFRLIRFNLEAKNPQKSNNHYFRGLPTTASGALFASLVLFSKPYGLPSSFYLAITLILSALMVSNISYPCLKHIRFSSHSRTAYLLGATTIVLALSSNIALIPLAGFSTYVAFGPIAVTDRRPTVKQAT